ncbi:MAG TPA: 50S ribosomal protein L19 [Candidatus Paceibacterota bacterium]
MAINKATHEERQKLDLRPGDVVRVTQTIEEKSEKKKADKKMEKQTRTRNQMFEGTVIARKHGGEVGGTFTVRKVASGVGVEKIFPLYSPGISKIEVVSRSKARRAKLYYIRKKAAKEISRKMRQERFSATASNIADELPAAEAAVPEVATAEVAG